MAVDREIRLRERQPFAFGDADLFAHEVGADDRLGDRVLDLQPCVDLEKPERVAREQEFDGARRGIPKLARGRERRFAHPLAHRLRHRAATALPR